MNPEEIRKRLQEISASLQTFSALEDFSAEQVSELEGLNAEYEKLSAKLELVEKTQANLAAASASTRKTSAPAPAPAMSVQVGATHKQEKFGGFNNSGEFLMAVKQASGGKVHDIFKSTAYEKNAEDGGYLVPQEMQQAITKKMGGDDSLWGKARSFNVGGNSLVVNVDETQPWNSGIQSYWTSEGGAITESKAAFKQASFRLNKLAALVKATDELLDDTVALESYIKTAAPESIMHKINDTMINGDGVGKPEGILNSAFTTSVAKESGQAADTLDAENIIKMYSRMFPQARANSAWYINAGAAEALHGLQDGNNQYIYLAPGSQMNSSPYGLLLGRPVIPMMSSLPALGDSGDIILADWNYYYGIQKAGVKQAQSIHLLFDREITAFRFSMRLDGKCPFTAPVTTQYGSYAMSAFVKLDDRT